MENLGTRIRKEAAGVYIGGAAEQVRKSTKAFGFTDNMIMHACSPRSNISTWQYLWLPSEVKRIIKTPDKSIMKGRDLVFFHYKLNSERVKETIDITKEQDFFANGSCIYSNFLGETIYVGSPELMQQTVDELKEGNFLEIANGLVGEVLAKHTTDYYVNVHVFDSVSKPKYAKLHLSS